MNYGSSKSAKIVLSKSIFDVKNQPNFFKKNLSFNLGINLGDHFLVKPFFSRLKFEAFFSKVLEKCNYRLLRQPRNLRIGCEKKEVLTVAYIFLSKVCKETRFILRTFVVQIYFSDVGFHFLYSTLKHSGEYSNMHRYIQVK